MTQMMEQRAAVFGEGLQVDREREDASMKVGAFLTRAEEIWEEEIIPRGIIISSRFDPEKNRGDEHSSSTKFLLSISPDKRYNPTTTIWRYGVEDGSERPDRTRCMTLETSPIVIQRKRDGIHAFEVPNAPEMYRNSFLDVYLEDEDKKIALPDDSFQGVDQTFELDEIEKPLFRDNATWKELDIRDVASLISTFDMDAVEAIPWMVNGGQNEWEDVIEDFGYDPDDLDGDEVDEASDDEKELRAFQAILGGQEDDEA